MDFARNLDFSPCFRMSPKALSIVDKRNASLKGGTFPNQRMFYGHPMRVYDCENVAFVHGSDRICLTGDGRNIVTCVFGPAINVCEVFAIGCDNYWFLESKLTRVNLPIGIYRLDEHVVWCYDAVSSTPSHVDVNGASLPVSERVRDVPVAQFGRESIVEYSSYVVSIEGEISILAYKRFNFEVVLAVDKLAADVKMDMTRGLAVVGKMEQSIGSTINIDVAHALVTFKVDQVIPTLLCGAESLMSVIVKRDKVACDDTPFVGVICNHKDKCVTSKSAFWSSYHNRPACVASSEKCWCGLSPGDRSYGSLTPDEIDDLFVDDFRRIVDPDLFPFEVKAQGIGAFVDSYFFVDSHLPNISDGDNVSVYYPWDPGYIELLTRRGLKVDVFTSLDFDWVATSVVIYFDNGSQDRWLEFYNWYTRLKEKPRDLISVGVYSDRMLQFYQVYHPNFKDIDLAVMKQELVGGLFVTVYSCEYGYIFEKINPVDNRPVLAIDAIDPSSKIFTALVMVHEDLVKLRVKELLGDSKQEWVDYKEIRGHFCDVDIDVILSRVLRGLLCTGDIEGIFYKPMKFETLEQAGSYRLSFKM